MVYGGTSPDTYNWSNNQKGATGTDPSAGSYSVSVTDNNGCTNVGGVTITRPATPFEVFISDIFLVSSGGNGDASISVTATGGSPSSHTCGLIILRAKQFPV